MSSIEKLFLIFILDGISRSKRQVDECPMTKRDIHCDKRALYRSIDGSCNNIRHPEWGQANQPLARMLDPQYNEGC